MQKLKCRQYGIFFQKDMILKANGRAAPKKCRDEAIDNCLRFGKDFKIGLKQKDIPVFLRMDS
jgi:hypothetical protein